MYVSYLLHVLSLSKPETLHKGWEKFFHSRLTNITDPQTMFLYQPPTKG